MTLINGLLVIDKPVGITSMDVIRKVRRLSGVKKVGHAGTLDPLATGVLLVCLGTATKKVESLMNTPKKYEVAINLSGFSETDDMEGKIDLVKVDQIPTLSEIKKTLLEFEGVIEQVPPRYSAVKISSQPAYKLARQGKVFELKSKKVTIFSIEVISYEWPNLELKIKCGRGTYIRSLARDLGRKLKTGGLVSKLRRTVVGQYNIELSKKLENLESITNEDLSLI